MVLIMASRYVLATIFLCAYLCIGGSAQSREQDDQWQMRRPQLFFGGNFPPWAGSGIPGFPGGGIPGIPGRRGVPGGGNPGGGLPGGGGKGWNFGHGFHFGKGAGGFGFGKPPTSKTDVGKAVRVPDGGGKWWSFGHDASHFGSGNPTHLTSNADDFMESGGGGVGGDGGYGRKRRSFGHGSHFSKEGSDFGNPTRVRSSADFAKGGRWGDGENGGNN